jgi:hypothetical protein
MLEHAISRDVGKPVAHSESDVAVQLQLQLEVEH